MLTFSDRDVIMWNVPEDAENSPSRIVFLNGRKEMVTQKETLQDKGRLLPDVPRRTADFWEMAVTPDRIMSPDPKMSIEELNDGMGPKEVRWDLEGGDQRTVTFGSVGCDERNRSRAARHMHCHLHSSYLCGVTE